MPRDRFVDLKSCGDPADVDDPIAVSPWNVRVYLGDDGFGGFYSGKGNVY